MEAAFGPGEPPATGFAPGRVTLVGEHVDYADGLTLCNAVHLGVAVCVRASRDARWRVASGSLVATRGDAEMRGDIADRVLAVARALHDAGVDAPRFEAGITADLPAGAGLSSSAALGVAVLVALLRLTGRRMAPEDAISVAHRAEHDVLGVPCGLLDQRAVVDAPAEGALLVDFRDGSEDRVPWAVTGTVLVAVDTGSPHDVAGAGYRERRAEADEALRCLGAPSWRDVDARDVAAARLPATLRRRARHLTSETRRAADAAVALRAGDAAELGRLMSASHASLRDDYDVSTASLDACCAAAEAVQGCHGARLVGAGFGGAAIALVAIDAAAAVRRAMEGALCDGPGGARGWVLTPSAGAAERAPDVLAGERGTHTSASGCSA